jgi:hypothetical protein
MPDRLRVTDVPHGPTWPGSAVPLRRGRLLMDDDQRLDCLDRYAHGGPAAVHPFPSCTTTLRAWWQRHHAVKVNRESSQITRRRRAWTAEDRLYVSAERQHLVQQIRAIKSRPPRRSCTFSAAGRLSSPRSVHRMGVWLRLKGAANAAGVNPDLPSGHSTHQETACGQPKSS